MIYEMIAGRKPFLGDTVVDIVASILNQHPDPLSAHSPEVPDRIDRIVARAMSKDKGDRYQTARELMIALKKQKQRLEFEAGLELSVSPDIGGGTTVAIRDGHAYAQGKHDRKHNHPKDFNHRAGHRHTSRSPARWL